MGILLLEIALIIVFSCSNPNAAKKSADITSVLLHKES